MLPITGCKYSAVKEEGYLVKEEGNNVGDKWGTYEINGELISLDNCKQFCSSRKSCKSFTFCTNQWSGNNCHLKDLDLAGKVTTENDDPLLTGCTSYYETECSGTLLTG